MNSNLRILVIEDDLATGEILVERLGEFGYQEIVCCHSDKEVIAQLKKQEFDLAFVDIQLDDSLLSGIDLAAQINKEYGFPIIFTTSFSSKSYLKQVSEIDHFDYLVKPYSKQQLFASMERLFLKLNVKEEPKTATDHFYVKGNDHFYNSVLFENFIYAKANGSSVEIYEQQAQRVKKHLNNCPLEHFIKQFPHPNLVRVHRSYAVNPQKVNARNETHLKLQTNDLIPFSKRYKDIVEKLFPLLRSK